MAKSSKKVGKLSIDEMRNLINKKVGMAVAYDLKNSNPTEVVDWIPTGSRWLDGIIKRGGFGGIPLGKVAEISGIEASGKSYMAAQIAANAQKMDIDVVYFDSESAIDPSFLEKAGCDLEELLYIQATNVEFVLETIEELLAANENRFLFIWDSLALTPTISDQEGDYDPSSTMAVKARVLSKGLSKLVVPIANSNSTLLVLNQLKKNITRNHIEAMLEPWFTPGGKALNYAYSLRIWLTARRAKSAYIQDDKGFRIGSEVKAKIKKSRFGTEGRECTFKILWGDDIGIQDEESWFEAIKASDFLVSNGPMFKLVYKDGSETKFYQKNWVKHMEDPKFKERVLELMEQEIVMKFHERKGDAESFYNIEDENDG